MAIINMIDTTKIYTSALLSILDNIKIQRTNSVYTVPVVYGDRSRLYKKLNDNNKIEGMENTLSIPAMSLEYVSIARALERQTNKMLKKTLANIDATSVRLNWNDSAMDFEYRLIIIAKSMTELTNLIGYILSSFKNGLYYVDVNLPLYTTPVSTPIVLNSAEPQIESNGDDYSLGRTLEAELSFTIKGLIHNNVETTSKLISHIQLKQYLDLEMNNLAQINIVE